MSQLVDLDRMKTRLAELDAEREPLLALIRAAEAYEGVVGKTLFSQGGVIVRHRSRADNGGGRAAPLMEATEKAVSEILELMGPLGTSELASLLDNKPALNLAMDNAVNVLSARLSNSERFESRRGVGWWFSDRHWPQKKGGSEPRHDSPTESQESPNGDSFDEMLG